jgi:hypothetical protein
MPMQQRTFPDPQPFSAEPRPPIELQDVDSSQVKAIGYDLATKTLAVRFTRGPGAIYHYPNVEPDTHAALTSAESVGSYFTQNIRQLPFVKFPAESAEPEFD